MSVNLFSSFTLGDVKLKNRIVMAPMTRSRATADHVPTPIMATHYANRASGGLLITEGAAPTPNGCGYPRIPGIWNDAQIAGWKAVTDAVHQAGGHIAIQIMHTGRTSHPLNMPKGSTILSSSATQVSGKMHTDQEGPQPHPEAKAMDEEQIEAAIQGYVTAAKNGIKAGFDFVEIHGANGYLIDQFTSPSANLRTDKWGGDIQGRGRFVLEVARRTANAIGAQRVGIRLSPFGVFNDITPWDTLHEDFTFLAKSLGALGLVYLHIVDHAAMGAPPVPQATKDALKEAFGGTIILSGGYDRARADTDLAAGKGQLVAFGRPYISNPDLAERLQSNAKLNDPDFSTFYTPGPKGYNDYPTLAE